MISNKKNEIHYCQIYSSQGFSSFFLYFISILLCFLDIEHILPFYLYYWHVTEFGN